MSPIVYFVTVGCLPLLILNLGLHIVDGVRGLNLEGDSLAGEGLHENLHVGRWGVARNRNKDGGWEGSSLRWPVLYAPDRAEFELLSQHTDDKRHRLDPASD